MSDLTRILSAIEQGPRAKRKQKCKVQRSVRRNCCTVWMSLAEAKIPTAWRVPPTFFIFHFSLFIFHFALSG